jgi:hypothetical protein
MLILKAMVQLSQYQIYPVGKSNSAVINGDDAVV